MQSVERRRRRWSMVSTFSMRSVFSPRFLPLAGALPEPPALDLREQRGAQIREAHQITTKMHRIETTQGAGKGKRVMGGGAPPAAQDDAAAAGTSGRDDKVRESTPLSLFKTTPGAPR